MDAACLAINHKGDKPRRSRRPLRRKHFLCDLCALRGCNSQSLTFDACDVRVQAESATATCPGAARYVPKFGSREPRTEPRVWSFTLHKSGSEWTIDSARAER